MTLNEMLSMDDLEVGSLWKGHHTKYVYEVLAWDGDYENGGMAFVKRTKKIDGYYEYKVVNIVDLLKAYDKLPAFPEIHQVWKNPYGQKFVVRHILTDEKTGDSWINLSEEGLVSVDYYTCVPAMEFVQKFKRVSP